MVASETLPDPKPVATPFRLIFWGVIVGTPYIKIDHFECPNVVIGTAMILWGVISLARVPVSLRYQRWMFVSEATAWLATILLFFACVLLPLSYMLNFGWFQTPLPDTFSYASKIVYVFVVFAGTVVFLYCMKEYCSVMNWERALASWRYSIRLMIYGVVGGGILLAIPLFVIISTLEFFPKNLPPITWAVQWNGDEGARYIAYRDGEIIYTSEPVPKGESFCRPNLGPSPGAGMNIHFGEWYAPIDGVRSGVFTLLMLSQFGLVLWTAIHILMSLSQMIHAAKRTNTLLHLSPRLAALHMRLWKAQRRRYWRTY